MLFSRCEVRIDEHRVYGKAWGEQVDVARHQPAVEVKGASYTALNVSLDESGNRPSVLWMYRSACHALVRVRVMDTSLLNRKLDFEWQIPQAG